MNTTTTVGRVYRAIQENNIYDRLYKNALQATTSPQINPLVQFDKPHKTIPDAIAIIKG